MGKRAHGEGTISKRVDGRWEARITLSDGRRKCFYAKTQAEARARLTAALRDRDVGLPAAGDERQTLADWLNAWLVAAKPTIRIRTWRRYEEYVRLHLIPSIGRIRLAKLTPNQVQQLYAKKLEAGLSAQTVRHLHAVLRRALNEAVRQGIIPRNVATIARPPKAPRHEMQVLTATQVQPLLDSLEGDRFEALYTVALSTGMRLGELLALRWRDVDLTCGRLQVRQTLHYLRKGGTSSPSPRPAAAGAASISPPRLWTPSSGTACARWSSSSPSARPGRTSTRCSHGRTVRRRWIRASPATTTSAFSPVLAGRSSASMI